MTYRVDLSKRALGQLDGFPSDAFDALVGIMSTVSEQPDNPLRTFPTSGPNIRRAVFGGVGLVTYGIDDATETITVIDVTCLGSRSRRNSAGRRA